jgi:hypothetical protein
LKPQFGVPTPWAYQQWRDGRELPGVDYGPQKIGDLTLETIWSGRFSRNIFSSRG